MWELKYKESWEPKNWFFRTVVWEKTLESPLDCKEIKPVNPERKSVLNIHWVLASAAHILNIHWKDWGWTPILWSSDGKKGLIGKDPDAGKDWRQEEKRTTEDEMVGWHHWLNGHEFEWAPGVGDGQGSLQCCSLCGHKESDMTERLNWTDTTLSSKQNVCKYFLSICEISFFKNCFLDYKSFWVYVGPIFFISGGGYLLLLPTKYHFLFYWVILPFSLKNLWPFFYVIFVSLSAQLSCLSSH